MSCHISLWCFKYSEWRIDLFGVWRRRVSLGKCVNVSMSGRRGGCTVKQERNWTLKWAKSLVRWNRLHQKKTKQTKKKRKKEKGKITKTTQGPIKVSSKAGWHKSKKQKQNKTNTLFFLLDIFQTADDKTTLKELEESKSNRQVCLTVSWIRVEAEAPHHIKPCKFSWKPPLSL